MLTGKPPINVPRQATREMQDVISNIARRLAALEAAVNLLPTSTATQANSPNEVNLTYQEFADRGIVRNNSGTDATIPLYSATRAGLVPAGFDPVSQVVATYGVSFTEADTPPSNPVAGDRWLDTTTSTLYTWAPSLGSNGEWI